MFYVMFMNVFDNVYNNLLINMFKDINNNISMSTKILTLLINPLARHLLEITTIKHVCVIGNRVQYVTNILRCTHTYKILSIIYS